MVGRNRHATRASAGISMLELVAGIAIITIGISAFLGSMNTLNRVQRSTTDRQQAIHLIANATERAESEAKRAKRPVTPADLARILALESDRYPDFQATLQIGGTNLEFRVAQTNEVPPRVVYRLELPTAK